MNRSTADIAAKVLLIVEDERLIALGLKCELESDGYEVLATTVRHEEALCAARAGRKPDLALVDIDLEAGDDGVAVARDLKALGVPVLFISGQASRARTGQAFAVASMAKPYDLSDVGEAVAYLFRHEQGDDSYPAPPRLELFDAAYGETPVRH